MENNKGLVARVAIGVFLGVMAALLVYSIPGWWRSYQANKEATEETALEIRLMDLTPKKMIANCGKPIKDIEDTSDKLVYDRTMTYRRSSGGTITLRFSGFPENGKTFWTGPINDGSLGQYDSSAWARYLRDTLPCAMKDTGGE